MKHNNIEVNIIQETKVMKHAKNYTVIYKGVSTNIKIVCDFRKVGENYTCVSSGRRALVATCFKLVSCFILRP
jgi:hypothetical protein